MSTFQHPFEKLNEGMLEASEPVLEKALQDIEKTMRQKLGSMVVAFLDESFEIDNMEHTLRILIKHDHGKA